MKIKGILGLALGFIAAAISDANVCVFLIAPVGLIGCMLLIAALIEDEQNKKRAETATLDALNQNEIA